MIDISKTGILIGGTDLSEVIGMFLQMLLDKDLINENELLGYMLKAGMKVSTPNDIKCEKGIH